MFIRGRRSPVNPLRCGFRTDQVLFRGCRGRHTRNGVPSQSLRTDQVLSEDKVWPCEYGRLEEASQSPRADQVLYEEAGAVTQGSCGPNPESQSLRTVQVLSEGSAGGDVSSHGPPVESQSLRTEGFPFRGYP
jgi:hypothetical protein